MRVFVAFEIPEATRQAIGQLVAELAPACRGARWARVEGIHVTLKFIGEAPPEQVERIRAELARVRSADAVEMRFRALGFFPNASHPRVFWVGIEASPNLAALAAEVDERMEALGIPRESRPFQPHLTLARFRSEDGLAGLRAAVARLGPAAFGSARLEEFHLYESKLRPGGAEYTRVATFRFTGSTA